MRETCAQRLRHPPGHDGSRGCKFVEIFLREPGQDYVEAIFDLMGAKPCQGADDYSRHPIRGRELPARRVPRSIPETRTCGRRRGFAPLQPPDAVTTVTTGCQRCPEYRQSRAIFSRLLPLVSGTNFQPKTKAKAQVNVKIQNTGAGEPKRSSDDSRSTGKA